MKNLIKSILARTNYRIVRRGSGNRFSAIESSLESLKARGFSPQIIIDGGANVGSFSAFALKLFPQAEVHAVEPQPGCQSRLEKLRIESAGRVIIHPVALCGPEQDGQILHMATDAHSLSTGAHVALESDQARTISVPCSTIDKLLANNIATRVSLLKLDLQGYELNALRGATSVLEKTDVILTEVSFFAQAYEPPISELMAFLAERGFELYDVASLYARPRDDRPRQGDLVFVRKSAPIAADGAWD